MGSAVGLRTQQSDQRGRRTLTKAVADSSIILGFLDQSEPCLKAYQRHEWVTTHAHLLEVYSTLDSRPEIKNADEILQTLLQFAIPIPDSAVRPAAEIRRKLRALRRDCSYVDALGYGVANALRIPLLIADDSFRDLKGVIWIPLPAKR